MEGVRTRRAAWHGLVGKLVWESARRMRQLHRRAGSAGLLMLLALILAGSAFALNHYARVLSRESVRAQPVRAVAAAAAPRGDPDAARLQAFSAQLLDYATVPEVIQNIMRLAEKQGLVMLRGDYVTDQNLAGGFARYRMSLPVKGDIRAVYAFMKNALKENPALAVESIVVKRERAEDAEVEVMIRWVIFTALPVRGAAQAPAAPLKQKEPA